MTREKYTELSEEVDHLKKVKRREIAESLEYAKSLGDLSENAEYQEAREMQAEVENRILKIEMILKNAVIVSDYKPGDRVSISSVVTLERESDKEKIEYTIVGSEEADLSKGKISTNSPLVTAMMGKKKGDKFTFNSPKGEVKYKIVKIV